MILKSAEFMELPADQEHEQDRVPARILIAIDIALHDQRSCAEPRENWRYSDTSINAIEHKDVGPDLSATGPANHTFDFSPDARAADYDDRNWEIIPAASLEGRRGHGRLSLNWYRLKVTLPDQVGGFPIRGSTATFEIVVDDYAEVWVNGQASWVLGQSGGSVAAGWNSPNRVVLTRDAVPRQEFQIAVLGINGPLSAHPDTYIWIRGVTLDFFGPGRLNHAWEVAFKVDRKDPGLDAVLPADAKLEKLADGFGFTEGPVWVPDASQIDGG